MSDGASSTPGTRPPYKPSSAQSGLVTSGATRSQAEPLLTAVVTIDGDTLDDIAMRLEDVAFQLRDRSRTLPVEIVGSHRIVTVRPALDAPYVDWRPDRV